ncbi:MAG: hypothetical protein CL526_12335 [Aequorivita sp.]|nr:hypothetical protein [Aequorivita sp.]|tara:strand:+ start:59093 stop:60064 length:972 start_codon:yes stop_codon:yes gene_type:complete
MTHQGILKREEFNSLNSPEKIKTLIDKNIFVIDRPPSMTNADAEIEDMDFSKFHGQEIKFSQTYLINECKLKFNPQLYHDICDTVYCPLPDKYAYRYDEKFHYDRSLADIKFQLTHTLTLQDKLSFLSIKLIELGPLKLKTLDVKSYDNKFVLGQRHIDKIDWTEELLQSWIFNDEEKILNFTEEYNSYMTTRMDVDDYGKFLLAKYCLDELEKIKSKIKLEKISKNDAYNSTNPPIIEKQKNWTNYEFAYFFIKTGLIKKMSETGLSLESISEIIGKAIRRDPKNFRIYFNEINTSSSNISSNRKKIQEGIDPIIQYFTKSE